MSQETEALLRSILYQIKMAKTIEEVEAAVEVMCSEETVAYVEKKVSERQKTKFYEPQETKK